MVEENVFRVLDEEIGKLNLEKLLYVFYKEIYNDLVPFWQSMKENLEEELAKTNGEFTKKVIRKELDELNRLYIFTPKPEDLKITGEMLNIVKAHITDCILTVLTDVCENMLQGELQPYLWKESPSAKLMKTGALFIHYTAKEKFAEIIDDVVNAIVRSLEKNMPETGIIDDRHIVEAAKVVDEKRISLDDLRWVVRSEVNRAISRLWWVMESWVESLKGTFDYGANDEIEDIESMGDEQTNLKEIKEKILELPEKELVEEMVAFAKEKIERNRHIYGKYVSVEKAVDPIAFLIEKFDLSSGYNSFELVKNLKNLLNDEEIRVKMDNIISSAKQKLKEETRRDFLRRLSKEREMLPRLVDECVEWARSLGLKYLKKEHVQTFLAEKNIELSQTMLDALHSSAYTKLLKKKK